MCRTFHVPDTDYGLRFLPYICSVKFYTPGKLLITGEYFVLCGAKSLALATRQGQSMEVKSTPGNGLVHWKAKRPNGEKWLETTFTSDNFSILSTTQREVSETLMLLLNECDNPFEAERNYEVETNLEFEPEWGLGSSSTLMVNLSKWTGTDPYVMQKKYFHGSGYDIATGINAAPTLYTLEKEQPLSVKIEWEPPFKNQLLFVYSGHKKISREAVKRFNCREVPEAIINQISRITESVIRCTDIEAFIEWMNQHEEITGKILQQEPLKHSFPDLQGTVKSLGAWGGDFFLAAGKEDLRKYFSNKGYQTMFHWDQIIL